MAGHGAGTKVNLPTLNKITVVKP